MKTEGSPGGRDVWEPRRGMGDPAACHAAGVQEGGNREELVSTGWRLTGAPVRGTNPPMPEQKSCRNRPRRYTERLQSILPRNSDETGVERSGATARGAAGPRGALASRIRASVACWCCCKQRGRHRRFRREKDEQVPEQVLRKGQDAPGCRRPGGGGRWAGSCGCRKMNVVLSLLLFPQCVCMCVCARVCV